MGTEATFQPSQHERETNAEMPMSTAKRLYIEKRLMDQADFYLARAALLCQQRPCGLGVVRQRQSA